MPTNANDLPANSSTALAVAAAQYADAKNRADAVTQAAWQKIIYSLVASKQQTLV